MVSPPPGVVISSLLFILVATRHPKCPRRSRLSTAGVLVLGRPEDHPAPDFRDRLGRATHVIHVAAFVQADGSLDLSTANVPANGPISLQPLMPRREVLFGRRQPLRSEQKSGGGLFVNRSFSL